MRKPRAMLYVSLGAVVLGASCGSSSPGFFTQKPACNSDPTVPLTAGDQVLVLNDLQIAPSGIGFDFGAGMPQNSLFALRALTKAPIAKAFTNRELVIPIELFDDKNGAQPSPCLKLSFYYGTYKLDRDTDMAKVGDAIGTGDCNDHDATIGPKMPEIAGDGIDNNCNGLADETIDPITKMVIPSTSTQDADGDGVTIAQGDCNDHDPKIKPAAKGGVEVCNNGLDDDCSGVADDLPCNPYDGSATAPVALNAASFVPGSSPLKPVILFDSAAIASLNVGTDAGGTVPVERLTGGPNIFSVTLPNIFGGFSLDLTLDSARLQGDVSTDSKGRLRIANGVLGGVATAQTLDGIKGINQPSLGITIDDSLLDAVFASGTLGRILALQQDNNGHYLPDVNVDGLALESFWASATDSGTQGSKIDTCQDNKGNVIMSTPTQRCVQTKDSNGKFLFNDGLSVALTFTAVPGAIQPTPTGP